MRKRRVLVLARSYPNSQFPTLGIWTQRLVEASSAVAEPTVVAPVPYVPPGIRVGRLGRFRAVEARQRTEDYDVYHPRVPVGPGQLLHAFDARMTFPAVRRLALTLAQRAAFDLVHAHFIYPEGVVAARLGRELGIPVVTTEHSVWKPWLDDHPRVGRQVEAALADIAVVTAVSDALRRNIQEFARERVPVEVLPNVVDERIFHPPRPGEPRDPDRLLFVGTIRRVKGLDVLVRALATLAVRRPSLRLGVAGGAFYRAYARDAAEVRALVAQLRLDGRVSFLGELSGLRVAEEMRRSAMLVVPSRRETFSLVTAEALATGTPVVATRCGGPEELLTPELGALVAPDDPDALASGIEEVLNRWGSFEPTTLRARVVERFGRDVVGRRIGELYAQVTARAGRSRFTPG